MRFLTQQIHRFRPHIHSIHDLAAAPGHRPLLKVFADPVEKHHTHTFQILADEESTDGSYGHEKIFIKYLAVPDTKDGLADDITAGNDIVAFFVFFLQDFQQLFELGDLALTAVIGLQMEIDQHQLPPAVRNRYARHEQCLPRKPCAR